MVEFSVQHGALMRLRRISGQVQGLTRMVTEGRAAMEIVAQVTAAEAALHGVARVILMDHLEARLLDGFKARGSREGAACVDEVMRIFMAMRPK